jgi:hypothetical protein
MLARFLAEDPAEFAGGDSNLYAYVRNRPIVLRDPLGLWSISGSFGFGFNAAVTVGYDAGGWFVEGIGGVGAGVGVTFNPWGQFSAPRCTQAYGGLGVQASVNVPIPHSPIPVGVGASGRYVGAWDLFGLGSGSSRTEADFSPFQITAPTFGLGASVTGGAAAGARLGGRECGCPPAKQGPPLSAPVPFR